MVLAEEEMVVRTACHQENCCSNVHENGPPGNVVRVAAEVFIGGEESFYTILSSLTFSREPMLSALFD